MLSHTRCTGLGGSGLTLKPGLSLSLPAPEQHLILGAEEGIYTLNLHSSEVTMELVRFYWILIIEEE